MSRFISAGTDEEVPNERDEAWRKAQQELESKKVQKAEADRQGGGKSLFETLEANKAAKQDAFEEANRLRNQFRSLDEDEIEFLDSVMESTRAKEAEVKKQTVAELDAFRRQQEEAEKTAQLAESANEKQATGDAWAVGPRKRKKGREGVVGGVKLRRTSTAEKTAAPVTSLAPEPAKSTVQPDLRTLDADRKVSTVPERSGATVKLTGDRTTKETASSAASSTPPASNPASPPATLLGLPAYSSDEDD